VTSTNAAGSNSGGSTSGSSSTAASSGAADRSGGGSQAAVAGAIRLADGQVSIPVASVLLPAHLILTRVVLSPHTITRRGVRLALVLRVTDSRGYVVRGALLGLTAKPAHGIKGLAVRKTGKDGIVRFGLQTTALLPLKRGTVLTLIVSAHGAGNAAANGIAATRRLTVPIAPSRSTGRSSR